MTDGSFKAGDLLFGVLDIEYGPQRALGDRRAGDHLWQGQDVVANLRREAKHAHDLGHPGTGDPLSLGDLGLVPGFAGTRRVSAPTLPFLNAPLGPSVTSTVCSQ